MSRQFMAFMVTAWLIGLFLMLILRTGSPS